MDNLLVNISLQIIQHASQQTNKNSQ